MYVPGGYNGPAAGRPEAEPAADRAEPVRLSPLYRRDTADTHNQVHITEYMCIVQKPFMYITLTGYMYNVHNRICVKRRVCTGHLCT